MKREIISTIAIVALMAVLIVPFAVGAKTYSGTVTMTTTMPLTTTTTGWDCISTPPPPTTTGDGTTTTTQPSTCGNAKDLLSSAAITVSDTMSILGSPVGGNWLCVDCYSYDGGTVTIVPTGYAETNSGYNYLHLTVTVNVPFAVDVRDDYNQWEEAYPFPAEAIRADGWIEKGSYVLCADYSMVWDALNYIRWIKITLSAPGSITVGHIALSDQATCGESAPRIQTTTRPSFPTYDTTFPPTTTTTWVLTGPDGTAPTSFPTTTTTTFPTNPTTNPTVGDAFVPGDVDDDGLVTSSDARLILLYCLEGTSLGGYGDFNFDGVISTQDVREILFSLTA
ncbi:MAG: hypothetical protein IKV35_07185 [Clostridia bacterium]|nr:hypothetical protein [Clostridia bacterium]